jgi:hypothetical protein
LLAEKGVRVDVFQSPAGGLVLALVGVAVYGALVAWARQPGHVDRWPALVAATGMGLVIAAANLGAQAIGWWGGHWSYALPVPLQVSFWVLWIAPFVTLLLAGYRWLVSHVRQPRLVYGLLGLGLLAPFTIVFDIWALNTGRLSMGGGYAIWHDVLVGQALFWLPVLFYEVARRQWPRHPPFVEAPSDR